MREFAVTPPSKSTWVLMVLLVVVLPCVLFVTGLLIAREQASRLPIAPFAFLPLILVAIGAGLGWCMRRARLRVGNGRWRLEAAWYTQEGNLSDLDAATAQVVDLKTRRELRPWLRSNGIGLPGFQAGHFRYWKGGKAFLLVTDASRVLAVRERSGRQLLVSLQRPQEALKALAGE
jgi:hypothetical protein